MITVENLTKRYGSFTAVDDISFTLQPGTVTGFLGPKGAGKSTAMRVMTGLTPPTSGRTTILGKPLHSCLILAARSGSSSTHRRSTPVAPDARSSRSGRW